MFSAVVTGKKLGEMILEEESQIFVPGPLLLLDGHLGSWVERENPGTFDGIGTWDE